MEKNQKIFIGVLIALVLVLGVVAVLGAGQGGSISEPESGKYDEFAMCLAEKGATFYGAFWCPHCKDQKTMFGSSQKFLNYVECSTPDGRSRTQACIDKNVDSYPTWEFADGSRINGTVALDILAEKTSCALPTETVVAEE